MTRNHYFNLFIFIFWSFSFVGNAQETKIDADSIMQKVLLYSTKNELNNCHITAYNNLIITANPNLIEGRIDSIFTIKRKKKVLFEIDSSDYIFKKIISKQHLYQTEKIAKYTFKLPKYQEKILAAKMAGFNEPILEYFSLQLTPISLYHKTYSIVEKKYISPISIKGLKKYAFTYLETTTIAKREVYRIEFKSKNKNKKHKLEGTLYIDSKNFAIAKAVFNITGLLKIVADYNFNYQDNLQKWIPSSNVLLIKKGISKVPIKILGETITFDGTESKWNEKGKKYASDFIEIKSYTRFFDPVFSSEMKLKNPDISIEISKSASTKKDTIWYSYFKDSTDVRSNATYVSLDSLSQKNKVENILYIGRKVLKGKYPISVFDLNLRYLFKYNNYEGFRLGLGGSTNERLSPYYKIGGYYVYGTKDGMFKGNIFNTVSLHNKTETLLTVSYTDDLSEIASTTFLVDKQSFKIYDPRPFNISTFYNHFTWSTTLYTKLIPKSETILQLSQSAIEPKFNYQFESGNVLYTKFKTTMATIAVQWNPFSKFMQTPSKRIEIEKQFPKFTFQFSKTISGFFENSFNFGKVDFRFDYLKKFNSTHQLTFLLEAGYAFGDVPITNAYNHSPNNLNKDKILQRITFAGRNSFETMNFNEFFSSKYVLLTLKHQFPKIKISRKIKPVLSLVTRYTIGSMRDSYRHKDFQFKTLENGYAESGFELNQIYQGLGFVAFYRYGPNRLATFEDNIAIKLSLKIDLGFN